MSYWYIDPPIIKKKQSGDTSVIISVEANYKYIYILISSCWEDSFHWTNNYMYIYAPESQGTLFDAMHIPNLVVYF